MSDDLFNAVRDQVQIDPEKDYLTDLVGEGKTYRDEKALARAVVEKEAMIARLKAEKVGIQDALVTKEQELASRVRLEELADRLAVREPTPSPSNGDMVRREPEVRETVPLKNLEEMLDERLNQRLAERDQSRAEAINFNTVQKRLQETLGPNYPNRLREIADQLEVGPEFLNSMAKSNPAAFFRLIGLDGTKAPVETFRAPPSSVMNSDAMVHRPSTGLKTQKYYNDLRKKDPANFYTTEVQMELHNNALKMGPEFFDA